MLGIVCGGGDYPRLVAQNCGEEFCLIFLEGFCDQNNWPGVPYTSIKLGEIGKALQFLKCNKVDRIVFAGHVRRPKFWQLKIDKIGCYWLLKCFPAFFNGDDKLLRRISHLLKEEGIETLAGTDFLQDIFLTAGIYSKKNPSEEDLNAIKIGFGAAKNLGAADIGQSIVVCGDKIIGSEDADGTNALIKNCGAKSRGCILVKTSKPQQDFRLDLPTIGPQTIDLLVKYQFKGLAVEAGKCIVLHREEVIKKVDEAGIFFVSLGEKKKIFIIAGEASGDYLAGRLMEDIKSVALEKNASATTREKNSENLKNKSEDEVEFFGIGGQCMLSSGLKTFFSINELSIIGIWEVVGKILHVRRLIKKTVAAILQYRPHAVITVDSSGFTHRVDRLLKKNNCPAPIIHYVAPPVWAWRKWRAKKLKNFIDKLLVLLPFEEKLFREHGVNADFIGHPIANDKDFDPPPAPELENFKTKYDLHKKIVVTLLPGSRSSEINSHMPILKDFAKKMHDANPTTQYIIPTIVSLENRIRELTETWHVKPIIVSTKHEKILAYYSSKFAIAASGTVTLELARVGLPAIVIYKTSAVTYWLVKLLIQVNKVSLINILAQKDVVPELLQHECSAENIFEHAQKMMQLHEAQRQKEEFEKIIEQLKGDDRAAAVSITNFIA